VKIRTKQSGMSLTEILTSLVIVVLLAALSMPALRAMLNSMSSTGSSEAMIGAALSNARAIAMKEQRYAGVRFQMGGSRTASGWPFNADQYMIFIISDNQGTKYANGFRVVNGTKPIKLPENIYVTDLTVSITANGTLNDVDNKNMPVFNDISTFSIVFSPQGNLVVHDVRVWNKTGDTDDSSGDDVFNTQTNIENSRAMFYEDNDNDDYSALGLRQEPSRRQFYIYEQNKFRNALGLNTAYSGYLSKLLPVYLNSYSGEILSAGKQ
jgi:Tfp pilus assembly protein FimT